jgi:rhodanese-related sulfurtransferase
MSRFAVLALFILNVAMPGISLAKSADDKPSDVVIIDVRTPGEFRDQAVQGAVNIDVTDSRFMARVNELDKSKTYKLYCRSGSRSGMAQQLMKAGGFNNLENLGTVSQAAAKLKRACVPRGC